ncbi:metal dependent phosphohydrolase [Syntrophobotulus glycolicus DSM 8271]|uniref:Metal dependent phosphohydrolase n=1 Tax=Syntrophobotulus glycolicus (strain DSM 8271 / FlGlyR) TaxID=645991 RepID=F0T1M5_SYNGF|nr:HD domain-containing phosphohydrolase [Syntrophobotulus glycolicus]ADY57449.1 metal dependent phosphohydrolase [Syntrophobotulus glycolicus DSM 8271]
MSEPFAKKNIYDENGLLLLAKGKKITDDVLARIQGSSISRIAWDLAEKINICNERNLEYTIEILSAIIADSQTKPWWFFVHALGSYVDWLYVHCIDVSMISLMIAMEMRYSDDELWNIGTGAFLHDAGKLLIPKSIIEKPGSLNDVEMEHIQQHCEFGMSSLEPCGIPKGCLDIVLQHHERLDGSGYPKGLKGKQIHPDVRIVMIADSIDAMISYRPYKPLQKMETAVKALKSDGRKYSQEIVSVLGKMLG